MPKISEAELMELARYRTIGTPDAVGKKIGDLEKDNRKQREEIKVLKEAAPEEGQLMISEQDGKDLKSYQELGKPDEVKTRLETGSKATNDLRTHALTVSATAFAKAAGLADEAVGTLVAIPDLKDAVFEVRKKKNDKGEEIDVPFLTLAGDGQAAMSFEDATEKVSSLKGLRMASPDEPGKPPGQTFVPSGGGGGKGGGKDDVYARIRKDAEAKTKSAEKQPDFKPVEERLGMTKVG